MLTVLNEITRWQNKDPGEIDLNGFKIVYIAPMKALVQEMVGHFQTHHHNRKMGCHHSQEYQYQLY